MKSVFTYLTQLESKVSQKTAISMNGDSLSFKELIEKTKQVASVIPVEMQHEPIAVIADRSINTLVHILAVIYSGNFYIPIDPDMPSEKMQAIIDDATPKVIMYNSDMRHVLDKIKHEASLVTSGNGSLENVRDMIECCADDPIYMVYTSGSTGKPKGVLKSHGAVASFVEAFCETFDIREDDVIGNQTPFFFDAFAKDFYLMLKTGATMDIIPTEKFAMPTGLIEHLNERKISIVLWVPTVLSMVAQLRIFTYILPEYLRKVFFVGEVLPTKYLNIWRKALPNVQYVNLFGSSEIAGICLYYEVLHELSDNQAIPMGKALKNCKVYLLDGDQIVAEPNVTGEIYVVSPAIAIEYYHDVEKTQNSFLMKDFGEGTNRCFKTGDLARYDEEGNLIFASRADFQIKHLGHRIELGEIESVANALPELRRCCCLYNTEKSKIVLFCEVSDTTEELTGLQIKSLLRTKLSSYMVPNKVIIVDKLPINANGKIDRQVLKQQL